eukprot:TRINITY_DN11453_c0_g1_i1.p1 TRINITY_DN11453_c0_g1~~TRINITY_DN11453_c0_g1_i1.p1  ORF type:complete len:105 (-),score=4.59 TRINITY_DN11453_c0_g1_i1:137-451(-)
MCIRDSPSISLHKEEYRFVFGRITCDLISSFVYIVKSSFQMMFKSFQSNQTLFLVELIHLAFFMKVVYPPEQDPPEQIAPLLIFQSFQFMKATSSIFSPSVFGS